MKPDQAPALLVERPFVARPSQQIPRLLLSDGQAFYEGVTTPKAEGPGVLAGSAWSHCQDEERQAQRQERQDEQECP